MKIKTHTHFKATLLQMSINSIDKAIGLLALSILVSTCTIPMSISQKQADVTPVFNAKPLSTYLTPEESIKTIHIPTGYHLELVASEPMIKEPVAIAWDGNARMYVAEMHLYAGCGCHRRTAAY